MEPTPPDAPGPNSEDVLAATREFVSAGGNVNPAATTNAVAEHFAAQDLADRAVIRATVERIPDGESRRAVLESGHDPAAEVSDDEQSDDPGSDPEDERSRRAMWPAQQEVVEAVRQDGGRTQEGP
eukprot:8714404-Alexandrium_andersonii.AAC.1